LSNSRTAIDRPVDRRLILGGLGAGIAALAGSLASASGAEAATSVVPVTRKVTQFLAVAHKYDARTRRTTVTRQRAVVVTARFTGSVITEKNRAGRWVRVPYVWSRARNGLVYDHFLFLQIVTVGKPPLGKSSPPVPSHNTPYVTTNAARHLLRRATFGVNEGLLTDITKLGSAAWLEWQLNPAAISDPVGDAIQARFPNQTRAIWAANDLISTGVIDGWDQMVEVGTAFTTGPFGVGGNCRL
jgi:hypothetical protein